MAVAMLGWRLAAQSLPCWVGDSQEGRAKPHCMCSGRHYQLNNSCALSPPCHCAQLPDLDAGATTSLQQQQASSQQAALPPSLAADRYRLRQLSGRGQQLCLCLLDP